MASDYVVVCALDPDSQRTAGLIAGLADSGLTVIAGNDAGSSPYFYDFMPDAAAIVVVCTEATAPDWWSPFGTDLGRVLLVTASARARVPVQLSDLTPIIAEGPGSGDPGYADLLRRVRSLVGDVKVRATEGLARQSFPALSLGAGEQAVSTPIWVVDQLSTLVEEVRDVGMLLADESEQTRLVQETLDEIGNSYRVVLHAIEVFYAAGRLRKKDLKKLAKIRAGSVETSIHEGRGHCKRIGARYFAEGGMRTGLHARGVSNDELSRADATFRRLTQADLDLFDALDAVGSSLAAEAAELYPMVLTDQGELAHRRFSSAMRVLAPLQTALIAALSNFHEVEQALGFAHDSAPEVPRVEDRSINIYGNVTNAVVAQTIERATIQLKSAELSPGLRRDMDELVGAVAAISDRLTNDDAEAAAAELDQLTNEISHKQPRAGIVKKCLRSLEQFGQMAAEVGLPLVELATKIAAAF